MTVEVSQSLLAVIQQQVAGGSTAAVQMEEQRNWPWTGVEMDSFIQDVSVRHFGQYIGKIGTVNPSNDGSETTVKQALSSMMGRFETHDII